MLIRKIALENVRSFLDRQELTFDGDISIIIGPNGGGKTNLLDTIVTMLRRYLLATPYLEPVNLPEGRQAWQLQPNQNLNSLILEKHASAPDEPQNVEVIVEVALGDLSNMTRMQAEADEIRQGLKKVYQGDPWEQTRQWNVAAIGAKTQLTYIWREGTLIPPQDEQARHFLEYLRLFEFDNACRAN